MDVLFVSSEAMELKPQIGVPLRMTWAELCNMLSSPTIGDSKECAGAWSPAQYRGNWRKQNRIERVHALVVDVDGGGHVERVAGLVSRYQAFVHSTFSDTPEAPRCRIVLPTSEPIDVPTYKAAHKVVRYHLESRGLTLDHGASDASRLCYMPVVRHWEGQRYQFRELDGEPLDAKAVIAAQPPPPKPKPVVHIDDRNRDRYVNGAIRSAVANIQAAREGERHHTLLQEAFSLARPKLNLDDATIENALLPAFIAVAGRHRQHEGERAIADAVKAGRDAA